MPNSGSDALKKMISENGEAVIYALDATTLVQESMERIGSFPPATVHLGQAMMAAALLQALTEMEDKETVSLQWMCEGPFGHLYAEARNYGEVRGTILNPQAPIRNYSTKLGTGLLQVRRTRKESTTGIVKAQGDVPLDLIEYLESSEQRSCGINFSVLIGWSNEEKTKFHVQHALAYLVHILPQSTEQKKQDALLRWDRQMRSLGEISKWILREDQVVLDMLRLISGEENPKVVMNQRVVFSCSCTEERAARALALLKAQEAKEGTQLQGLNTEVRCEYCGRAYTITSIQ